MLIPPHGLVIPPLQSCIRDSDETEVLLSFVQCVSQPAFTVLMEGLAGQPASLSELRKWCGVEGAGSIAVS